MISNVILNLILVQFYGHIGLAAATSISALINATLLYFFLIQQSIFKFNISFYKMLIKVLFAVTIMAMYIWYFETPIEYYLDSSLSERVLSISRTIIISAVIYFSTLYTLGIRLKQL